MHFYQSALHNRSVANVTSSLFCFTGSQNTDCTWGCWKIRKWVGRTDSVCLQWHRSGEHQLHFHGSRKHRNSQGISQLNSVWELKEELISSTQLFSLSLPAWLTEIPSLVSAASLFFQRTANIHVEHVCVLWWEGIVIFQPVHAQWFIKIRHETIIYRTEHSLAFQCLCVGLLQQKRWWWCSGPVMLKGSSITAIFLVGGVQPFKILFW